MAARARRTLTARELRPCIRKLSWRRLTEVYQDTRSQTVRRMIEAEARRCGYRMSGFVLAQALQRMAED